MSSNRRSRLGTSSFGGGLRSLLRAQPEKAHKSRGFLVSRSCASNADTSTDDPRAAQISRISDCTESPVKEGETVLCPSRAGAAASQLCKKIAYAAPALALSKSAGWFGIGPQTSTHGFQNISGDRLPTRAARRVVPRRRIGRASLSCISSSPIAALTSARL
jgi:hypothetical protein